MVKPWEIDGKRVIRVFATRTRQTPDDKMVRVNVGPGLLDQADEIHVSASFTWELDRAMQLSKLWEAVAPVKFGGPATGQRSEDFTPGRYLRMGNVITSRGCPNKCWFCYVWKREGDGVREIPITHGNNVCDDNLLACSDDHILGVFRMLGDKKVVKFTGGFEAARLKDWHIDQLVVIKKQLTSMLFAYDTPDDLEPLQVAGKKLVNAGIIDRSNSVARCYVLVGYPKDTYGRAEERVHETMRAGFSVYVMPYRGDDGVQHGGWKKFYDRWQSSTKIKIAISSEARKHLFDGTPRRKPGRPKGSTNVGSISEET